ncbi:hypothetical protein [Labrenzia sp. VG12]|uniref:hypothetical protein n=1 Tax=Labrenzia sp. VG12 TaxID=2021862 RepID=UPI000B8C270F|nr:hypothetical protein [Labrenzia sp. VG12]ASP33134.1 hypothetical protein CHH27_07650 [Labrenzia sp. VG12]
MRKFLTCSAAGLFAGLAMTSVAEARPDLRQMTCAQAQQMVLQHGAVVFTTGQHTYSMFVSNLSYCDRNQVLFTQYGQTRDARKCPVAYECKEPLFPRGGFNRWN